MLWNVNDEKPKAVLRLPPKVQSNKQMPPTLLDVNKTKWMSNGNCLGCATEALGSFVFDVRARTVLNTFNSTNVQLKENAKYSLAFSQTGRLLFVACEDGSIEIWDTLLPDQKEPLFKANNVHNNRVTDIAVPNSGFCLAATSWDATGSITAP